MMNIIIADDELLMRIGLKSMINWEEHGCQIVGEAANGKEALDMAQRLKPDLIITDIKMPIMDGLTLIREMLHDKVDCQFIILSCMDEFQYAKEALRLGAVDYLIKSDLKPQQLLEVLEVVKHNARQRAIQGGNMMLKEQYKDSISYLKETLFKDLFSGFRSEEEMLERIETFQISVKQGKLVLVKLRINDFGSIRQKYVEQDEKLLRYAVMNIMEEIIPRKWQKEIIVETSSEYLLIMNIDDMLEQIPRQQLNSLFEKIKTTMKDFLNIGISIGVSSLAHGFIGLRAAYREADTAMEQHFFETNNDVQYMDSLSMREECRRENFSLTLDEETAFRQIVEDQEAVGTEFLAKLKKRLYEEGISEQGVRKAYIRMISLISSCFPIVPDFLIEGLTPYEQMMKEEKLEGIHAVTVGFLQHCQQHNSEQQLGLHSYGEQARLIIIEHHAEDISLQSVANLISVNPSYLSRVFKRETGETFVSFLTRVRIEKAQRLLRSKHMRIYEVASQVGYPNTAYFSKIFKKITGFTPEEFRNLE